jgi:hypothetical protein
MKRRIHLICLLFTLMINACQGNIPDTTATTSKLSLKSGLPANPYASLETPFDYRGFNLSDRDLRQAITELKQTTFDSRTQWPAQEYLPAGFDPKQVFAYGTDPGLGVSELHERGIRGQGISIAIVAVSYTHLTLPTTPYV